MNIRKILTQSLPLLYFLICWFAYANSDGSVLSTNFLGAAYPLQNEFWEVFYLFAVSIAFFYLFDRRVDRLIEAMTVIQSIPYFYQIGVFVVTIINYHGFSVSEVSVVNAQNVSASKMIYLLALFSLVVLYNIKGVRALNTFIYILLPMVVLLVANLNRFDKQSLDWTILYFGMGVFACLTAFFGHYVMAFLLRFKTYKVILLGAFFSASVAHLLVQAGNLKHTPSGFEFNTHSAISFVLSPAGYIFSAIAAVFFIILFLDSKYAD